MYNGLSQWIRFDAMLIDLALDMQLRLLECQKEFLTHQLNLIHGHATRREEDKHQCGLGPRGFWWLDHYGHRAHDVDVERL